MDKDFVEEMKKILTEEKERIEEELSHFTHRNPDIDGDYEADFPNRGDKEDENASEVAQYSDNLSLEDKLEKALRDINQSLERMKNDKYGICKYCNEEIDERRVRARPTSGSCIKCKKTFTQEV